MKKTILSLLLLALLTLVRPLAAQISPTVSVQGTNATLRWASTPGESYVVLYRRAFHPAPELQWQVIGTNVPASGGIETFFQHIGGVPRVPAGYTGGGGGGGSSPPVLLSATSPTTDPTQDKDDKLKAKDSELPAFPSLPDEKEIEKWLKELLKEYERQQREGGGVPAFTALMASTLTAEQATSNSMGFYVVTRPVDDTDADGLPDWWEAANGLNPLENDAGADPDGDGASNLAEYNYQTNPRNPNSRPAIQLTFTSPVNTSTYLPVIQITGQLNLNLRTLSYSVTNAAGVLADVAGFATSRTVTPGPGFTNSPSTHSSGFQCFDVPLTNGLNTVGLRFTDAYGLTHLTNVTFTVNFAASPAAPQATLLWPGQGAVIAADTFTLRGRLDNPTAQVVARITLGGTEQEFGGVVERDGTFWLEDLPTPPSGTVQLVATDAGGKASTNTFSVSRSAVTLSLNPPAGPGLWNSTVDLSGTVSHTNYVFYVNSRRASVNASGGWIATNVPVNAGGVATFAFRGAEIANIIPLGFPTPMAGNGGQGGLYSLPTGNPGGFGDGSSVDAIFDFDKPPRIVVASYTRRVQDDNPTLTTGHTNRTTLDWTRSGAGYSGLYTSYWLSQRYAYNIWWQTGAVTYPFPGTNGTEVASGFFSSGDPIAYTNLVGPPPIPWEQGQLSLRAESRAFNYKVDTRLFLQIGGKGSPERTKFDEVSVAAIYLDENGQSLATVPASGLLALGLVPMPDGVVLSATLPSNTELDATPAITLPYAIFAAATPGSPSRQSVGERASFDVGTGEHVFEFVHHSISNGVSPRPDRVLRLGYDRLKVLSRISTSQNNAFTRAMNVDLFVGSVSNKVSFQNVSYNATQFRGATYIPLDWSGSRNGTNVPDYINPLTFQSWVRAEARLTNAQPYYQSYVGRAQRSLNGLRTQARAVIGRTSAGEADTADNLAAVSGRLAQMGYTVVFNDSSLTSTEVSNNVPGGLVFYSISHASTSALNLDDGILVPSLLPNGLNYSLVVFSGCYIGANAALLNSFAQKFGSNVAVVAVNKQVLSPVIKAFTGDFFISLAQGNSVQRAVENSVQPAQTVAPDLFISIHDVVVLNGNKIIDLTR